MTPDIAHVRAILADYDPRCDRLRIARPGSGIANDVFLVETAQVALVLKVHDDATSRWKPQKERAVFAHMRTLGLPAPVVVGVDTSRRIAPFAYSLSERLPGEPYSRVFPRLSEKVNAGIYAQLGDFLGRLHATTFETFGAPCSGSEGLRVGPVHDLACDARESPGPFATWRELHDAIVRARLDLMRGTVFDDLIPEIAAFFAAEGDQIAGNFVPRLLHMDLHHGNVLVENGTVTGILDVEEAIVGHNEYDLMRTELALFRGQPPMLAEAFLQAYAVHVELDKGYDDRKRFYDLSRSLAWIRSLILHGDRYAGGAAAHDHRAARAHVRALLAGR